MEFRFDRRGDGVVEISVGDRYLGFSKALMDCLVPQPPTVASQLSRIDDALTAVGHALATCRQDGAPDSGYPFLSGPQTLLVGPRAGFWTVVAHSRTGGFANEEMLMGDFRGALLGWHRCLGRLTNAE